jgi:thioredoxin reductase (NADPH)
MDEYDVIIIGSGPAGLTAGIYLARARRHVVLLGEKIFDSPVTNLDSIENYPGYVEPVSGSQLIAEMINQVLKYGLPLEQAKVTGIETINRKYKVVCSDNRIFTSKILIIASGTLHKKLGVPGEELLAGKGVFNCGLCDGGKYAGKPVAVCGGGDAGVTEAIYMTKLASEVTLIEAMPELTANAILRERVNENTKIKILRGAKIEAIIGDTKVEGIQCLIEDSHEIFKVKGVLVQIGLLPNVGFLKGIVPLDSTGHIIVNVKMETPIAGILASGDVRSNSPNQIVTATGDGATAGITADRLLQQF